MRIKKIFAPFLVLTLVLFSSSSLAVSLACDVDQAAIQALFSEGMVPFDDETSSSCALNNIRYKFKNATSASRACSPPTTKSLLPDGTIVDGWDPNACDTGLDGAYEIRQASSSSHTVCSLSSPVPSTYIVTKHNISGGNCRTGDQMKIEIPGAIDYMCQISTPVPPGYIVTEIRSSSDCTGSQLKIEVPVASKSYTVCAASPVPPGYGYYGVGSYAKCSSSGSGPGYKIRPVTGTTETLCARSVNDIPAGYLVTSFPSAELDCSSGSTVKVTKLSSVSGTIRAYELGGLETLPTGYVIIRRGSSGGDDWYDIKIPSGSTRICQGSSLPNGYAIFGQGSSSSLCGSSTPTYFDIDLLSGNGPITICANHSVPNGYVITERKSSAVSECPSPGGYVVVKPSTTPGNETLMCDSGQHVIPENFVIVEKKNYSVCKVGVGSSPGTKITKPSNTSDTPVCQGSPIPNGFIVKNTGTSSRCGTLPIGSTVIIGIADGPGPYSVCSLVDLPVDYIITSSTTAGVCNGTTYTMKLPDSGQTQICSISPIPDNYVIVGKSTLGSCAIGNDYIIQLPDPSGLTAVCSIPARPIPTGFINPGFGGGFSSACDGNGFLIKPFNDAGSITPGSFVDQEQDVTSAPSNTSVQCYSGAINNGLITSAQKNTALCN
jgi:hypothetical protein